LVKLKVETSKMHEIFIEKNLLSSISDKLNFLPNCCNILIVTDKNVKRLYLETLINNLKTSNFQVYTFIVPAEEKSKSFKQAIKIYDFLCKHNFSRSDCILSLGGGVVGDLAGFVASTFLRGVRFVNIPTSLLAQVDSAIGGKNGIDTPYGKNLVGSFYYPKAILIDPSLIYTLPSREISNGFAEIIKYALIKDKDLFFKLKELDLSNLHENLADIILKCVLIKKEIIEKDEFDQNYRMILNFGHTLGHAIEKLGNFKKYSHGQAISIGMIMIVKACVRKNILDKSLLSDLESILHKFSLPTSCNINERKIVLASLNDKKFFNNKVNVVLISNVGEGYIQPFSKDEFIKFLL